MVKNANTTENPAAGATSLQIVVSLKSSAEYAAWLAALAEHQRVRTVEVVDLALVHFAKHVGFETPAPPRYVRR